MTDIAVTKATLENGTLTVTGTGFTKTTTTLFVDGNETPFEAESGEQITASVGNASVVWAAKGEIESDHVTVGHNGGTRQAADTPDPDDEKADASPQELEKAANAGAEVKTPQNPTQPEFGTAKEGEHVEAKDFRAAVHQTAAGDLNQDPREPYPTGNPQDPREAFHRIHGHYPADESGDKDAQARQMDADPAT